jgi:hypothetical protein
MATEIHNGPRFIRQPQIEARHEKLALLEISKNKKGHPSANWVGIIAVKSGLTVPHDGTALEEERVDGVQSVGKRIFGVDSFPEVLKRLKLL